jgi:regulator of protease activity HflC (stomatin/prohibitin superfamily)
MGGIILLLILVLLLIVGVVTSVRLYSEGAVRSGRFKNVHRVRTIKEAPDGRVLEETIEETIDEEEPVEEPES